MSDLPTKVAEKIAEHLINYGFNDDVVELLIATREGREPKGVIADIICTAIAPMVEALEEIEKRIEMDKPKHDVDCECSICWSHQGLAGSIMRIIRKAKEE